VAIEYIIIAICDKCGDHIEPATYVKKSELDSKRWDWEHKWKQEGVMQGLPSLYGKRKLYCRKCAG